MLFIFLPFILAILGFMIAMFCFIGICLLVIGITGSIMNRIYIRQTKSERKVSKTLCNAGAVFFGIAFILFPFGYMLYGIISSIR